MNCWKPKPQGMVISSQAVLATEGSTTILAGSREQSRSARQL
nr:MAG TPA: Methanol dehydrogenase beta subunit [Caudoviricetes sp.]